MNIEIRYYTRSKKGNTKKIANFISEKTKIEAKDVSYPLVEDVDKLILVNAMYAANIDKQVKDFLIKNKDRIKCLINVNSSASGASTYKSVKKVCDKYGINISDKEFHTVASWIFLNKDRPNKDDFDRLEKFILEVING